MRWLVFVVLAAGSAIAHADVAAELAAIPKAMPSCDKARAHCFGIQLHVAPDEQGNLIVTSDWLAQQVAEAERHFTPLDVGFEVVGADLLPDAARHLETRKDRDALAAGGLPGRVIHVYITGKLDDVDTAGAIAYGVTWRRDDRKYIIVSAAAWPRTLAHELGHFFGLPHSTYAISIMNKSDRKDPPREQRTFADAEIVAMRPAVVRLVRDKVIAERPRAKD